VQRSGLAALMEFILSSPELQTNKITDDEVKTKNSIELRLTETLLIVYKEIRIYSPDRIVAIFHPLFIFTIRDGLSIITMHPVYQ